MENLTYEEKLAKLEVELVESKTAAELNRKSNQEIHLQNMIMYGMFFKNRGVDFPLYNLRRIDYYNKNEFEFSFYFNTEENSHWNQITVDIVYNSENNTTKVTRINFPFSSMKDIDFEKNIKYHQNVVKLLEVLKDIDSFIPYLKNYKTLENPIEVRTEYMINNEIESVKESIRIRDLKLSVGSKVMININTSKRRHYREYWVKSTIVKINQKTIQYVINYDNGNISDVQKIYLDYSKFKSIEQYEAEQKELEEKLNKPIV